MNNSRDQEYSGKTKMICIWDFLSYKGIHYESELYYCSDDKEDKQSERNKSDSNEVEKNF